MSLLEWLKFWSKFHRILLFCSNLVQNTPPPHKLKLSESPNPRCPRIPTPQWKLSESPNLRCPRIPPQNENCHRVQIWGVPEYPPKWKLSESPNARCPRIPPPHTHTNWKLKFSFLSPNFMLPRIPPPNWKLKFSFLSPNFMLPRICPPPKLKTLVFFPKSKFHVTQSTPSQIENFSFLS